MSILNVGNTQAELAGRTLLDTDPTRFDPAYSPNAVALPVDRLAFAQPLDVKFPAPVGDLWIHFQIFTPSFGNPSFVDGFWFDIRDDQDRPLVGIDVLDLNWHTEAYGQSDVEGADFAIPENAPVPVDIRVAHGVTNEIEIYISGALMSRAATNNDGRGAPVRMYLPHHTFTESGGQTVTYSELIVTDGEPTLGWRLATNTPGSAGFHTGWSGTVADLADSDLSTFMTAANPGERFSWNPAPYTGPDLPGGVRALCAKAQAQRGFDGPQNFRQFVRVNGTDYDSPQSSPVGELQIGELHVWDENPETLAAWATADIANIEIGIASEA